MLTAIMYGDGVAQHVRDNHGTAGPGLDDILGALFILNFHLFRKVVVNKRTLLQAAWHRSGSYQRFLPVRRRRTINLSLGLFCRRVLPSTCPQGLTGWRPPDVLPSPPP